MTKNDIFSTRKLSGGFSAENGHWGWDGWKGLSWSNSCLQWRVVILLIPTSSSLPPLWSIPAQAGIPLACTPTSMHLALDELIWFVKLVLVLLRWWVEMHSQGNQSKARAVTGWGSKVLVGGGVRIREGREGSRKGLGDVVSGFTLAHCWGVSHLSVWEGWSRKDRQAQFFTVPIYLIQLYRKKSTLHTIAAAEKMWGMATEGGEGGFVLGRQRCR